MLTDRIEAKRIDLLRLDARLYIFPPGVIAMPTRYRTGIFSEGALLG
jgi:hypothetical protein